MLYKIIEIESGKVVAQENDLASLTVLEGDFVIVTSKGHSYAFDKVLYKINITSEECITVVCYGETEIYTNRQAAINTYRKCIENSEGSEQRRYSKIYTELCAGLNYCTDEEETNG